MPTQTTDAPWTPPMEGFTTMTSLQNVTGYVTRRTSSVGATTLDPLYDPSLKYLSKLSRPADMVLGTYMVILSSMTVAMNVLVLVTMYRQSRRLSPVEIYVANLALVDLCPAVLEYPLTAASAYLHGWAFGDIGCKLCASVVYFFGVASITTITLMSLMRYIIICHSSVTGDAITRRFVMITLIPIYINSLVWSVAPLLGWGSYAPEPHGNACTLDWRHLSVSYIICMFRFVYVLPCVVIAYSYSRMFCTLHSAEQSMHNVGNRKDLYVAKMTLAMSAAFIIAWTPYAILAFHYILADYKDVPITLAVLPPYFAKSSTLYNPVVYFLAVKRFRKDLESLLRGIFGLRKKSYSRQQKRVGQADTGSSGSDYTSLKPGKQLRHEPPETDRVEIEMTYQSSRTLLPDATESHVSLLAPEILGNESNNNNNNNNNNVHNGNGVCHVANGIYTMSVQ